MNTAGVLDDYLEQLLGDAVQVIVRMTMEVEGQARPGCVIDTISRYTFNPNFK